MATIGVSDLGKENITKIKQRFGFNEEKDVGLFAFAYALYNKLETPKVSGKETKWGTSTFDGEGRDIEEIFRILYHNVDNEERKIQSFIGDIIEAGLSKIVTLIDDDPNLKNISELLP